MLCRSKSISKAFDSLVGVLSLDDFLVWRLQTLATPVYGIVMYLSHQQQCCIPSDLNYQTYTGKLLTSSSSSGASRRPTGFLTRNTCLTFSIMPYSYHDNTIHALSESSGISHIQCLGCYYFKFACKELLLYNLYVSNLIGP